MMVSVFREYTLKQLIIACGIARKLTLMEICRVADCTKPYYFKCKKQADIQQLIVEFSRLPLEGDIREYNGLPTIMMMIAQFLYSLAEKELFTQ